MQHILYSVQTRTHPGNVRENNEDALGTVLDWREVLELGDEVLQQRGHLFAVADGMGGHAAGEVASNLAISTLFIEYYTNEWVDPKTTLAAAIKTANQAIFEMAGDNAAMSGMGTTLVAALYQPEQWLIANVGDSRAYLFRTGKIRQVTQDHSWVAEQVSSGILTQDQASHHPLRNVITRSLGGEATVNVDFFSLDARPGDIVLLCSDGLSNVVSEKEMGKILHAYTLDEAAERLLGLSLERGAPDNVTFALVQLIGDGRRRSRSLLPWLAIIAAVLILGGFVYWSFVRQAPSPAGPAKSPVVAIGTFTPVVTPAVTSSPSVSEPASTPATPTAPSSTPGMSAAGESSARLGHENAVVFATPDPADARTLLFVSGQGRVEPISEDEDWETLIVVTDAGETFSATLDKARYVGHQTTIIGGQVALAGYAQETTQGGEQALEPLLLLSPFDDSDAFAVIWRADDDALQTFVQRFGLDDRLIPAPDSRIIRLNLNR